MWPWEAGCCLLVAAKAALNQSPELPESEVMAEAME